MKWIAAAVLLCEVLAARSARAGDSERKALIDAAVQARDQGNHARALELARSADSMRSTSSLTRFIAEEQQAVGKLPEAFDAARRCLRLAEGEEPSADHDAVLIGCRTLAAELRARVALVSLRLPSPPPPGTFVRFDGAPVVPAREPIATNPGAIVIEAGAPGRIPFTTTTHAPAGEETAVTVVLELLPSAPPPIAAPAASPLPPEATPHRASLVGPVVGGLGVVALATAGVVHLVANGRYEDLKTQCSGGCADGDARRSAIEQLDQNLARDRGGRRDARRSRGDAVRARSPAPRGDGAARRRPHRRLAERILLMHAVLCPGFAAGPPWGRPRLFGVTGCRPPGVLTRSRLEVRVRSNRPSASSAGRARARA